MFDEENLISLAIFLSFCLFVHKTYIQPYDYEAVYFSQNFCVFRIISSLFCEIFVLFSYDIFALFFREIFIFFFAKFSHYFFREIFALFFRIFSRNFRIFYLAKIQHFFAKQIEAKFREKSEKSKNLRIIRERTKCENEAKWSRKKKIFAKNAKFSQNDFSFSLETLVATHWPLCTCTS